MLQEITNKENRKKYRMVFNRFTKHLPTSLAFAGALGLSVESYLSLNNRSLCPTEACQTVGKYLSIGEPLLVAAGAAFFWILSLILFLAIRNPEKLKNWPAYLLAGALTIDSSLIGFQFFTVQQHCILCISVAVLLLVIAVIYCLAEKSLFLFVFFSFIWLGGFFVQDIMTIPPPQGAYQKMFFLSLQHEEASKSGKPVETLIVSMNCPHCLDVVKFLSDKYPIDRNFRLASVDLDEESLAKINLFLQKVKHASNPFGLFKEIKEKELHKDEVLPGTDSLLTQNKNALLFLSNIGITSIPVLVVDISNHEKKILSGSTEIIEYLKNR